jgi:hypothetical protein
MTTNKDKPVFKSIEGSYEDLKERITEAAATQIGTGNYDIHVKATFSDHAIIIICPYNTDNMPMVDTEPKRYEYPYTDNADGSITLGTPVEVEKETNYVPTNQKMNPVKMGAFASKDESKRLVNGPVMIPDCPDCDFGRGEKVFNADEVEAFCHKFNTFRINDDMHTYGSNGEQTGDVVENYTLKRELTETNVLGDEVTYPIGTWMITSKVTNDKTWLDVQNKVLKGYSGTYIPEEDANKLLKSLSANKNESDVLSNVYASKRTNIADIEKPVCVTVSFVDRPCVTNAIFTAIKSDDSLVIKAGRMISSVNSATLQKAYDAIGALLKAQDNTNNINKSKPLEVLDMEEKDVMKMIDEAVTKATTESKKEIDELKDEIESLKGKPEPEEPEDLEAKKAVAAPKLTPAEIKTLIAECKAGKVASCGALNRAGVVVKEDPESLEENPVIKSILDKLGIDPASQKLDEPDKTKDEVYKGREDRDAFGRKIKD